MLYYYALYIKDIEDHPDQEPSGLIIQGLGYRESMMWDHRAQAWRYNPETVGNIMGSWRYDFRRRPVQREEAERIGLAITKGADPLPSEAEIEAIFAESHRRRAAGELD